MRKDSAGLEEMCRIGRCAEFPIDGHSGCEVRALALNASIRRSGIASQVDTVSVRTRDGCKNLVVHARWRPLYHRRAMLKT